MTDTPLQLLRDIQANMRRAWDDRTLSEDAWPASLSRRLSAMLEPKAEQPSEDHWLAAAHDAGARIKQLEQPAAQGEPNINASEALRLLHSCSDVLHDMSGSDVGGSDSVAALAREVRHFLAGKPAPSPAAQVPEGWQLVPKKCTEVMKDVGIPLEYATIHDGRLLAQLMWNELLSASPKPPEPQEPQSEPMGRKEWCQRAESVFIQAGDDPKFAQEQSEWLWGQQDFDDLEDPTVAAKEDIEGRPRPTSPNSILQAVDALLRVELDCVYVHPCDMHNDDVRARGLQGLMLDLYRARRGVNQPPSQAVEQAAEPFAWATFDGEGGYELRLYAGNEGYKDEYIKRNGVAYSDWVFLLRRGEAVEQAVAAEREACAKVCDDMAEKNEANQSQQLALDLAADAIRARSSQAEKGGAL